MEKQMILNLINLFQIIVSRIYNVLAYFDITTIGPGWIWWWIGEDTDVDSFNAADDELKSEKERHFLLQEVKFVSFGILRLIHENKFYIVSFCWIYLYWSQSFTYLSNILGHRMNQYANKLSLA